MRKARGLSQDALAEKMEGRPRIPCSVERGEQNPTIALLMTLAGALQVELVALFNYEWQWMNEADLKRKLHAMVDHADLNAWREVFALIKAREL